jgi:hypothetical protein
MTPEELIALLDAMCTVALGERRTKAGQTVYTLTLDDIHEADAILDGSFLLEE